MEAMRGTQSKSEAPEAGGFFVTFILPHAQKPDTVG